MLAANEAFYRAFNERDYEAMDALWAHETPVFCVHPGWRVLVGREPVLQSWRDILANPSQSRLFAGAQHISIVGDVAIVLCSELLDGGLLSATNVFVREGGEWRLCHHHSGGVALAG